MPVFSKEQVQVDSWSDEEVVSRVLAGEIALYEIIMRRYNQRLYRIARSIIRDGNEAEDIMQEAYVRAFQHLRDFAGRSSFATWLTRIAIHEALARAKKRERLADFDPTDEANESMSLLQSSSPTPEKNVAEAESQALLEKSILALPESYRTVLIMRDVEEMTTSEVAEALDLTGENVKVRLHRARALLRDQLYEVAGRNAVRVLRFGAVRCDRVVAAAFSRIGELTARGA